MFWRRLCVVAPKRTQTFRKPLIRTRPSASLRDESTRISPWVALPTGAVAGLMGSLCGVGGGVVMIPALSTFTRMTPHAISAASLLCVSVASTTGAVSYFEQGFTNVPLALTLMTTSVPAAALGARMLHFVPGIWLKRISALAMLSAAPKVWLNAERSAQQSESPADAEHCASESNLHEASLKSLQERNAITSERVLAARPSDAAQFLIDNAGFVALGVLTGLASGLIGIGGGLVMNTFMGALTVMPQHEIIATSLAVAVPIGVSGSLVHYRAGRINAGSCILLAGSACLAMAVTSRYLGGVDDSRLKRVFAVLLVTSSLNMLR